MRLPCCRATDRAGSDRAGRSCARAVGERFDLRFTCATFPVGAAAVAVANDPLPRGRAPLSRTRMRCCSARWGIRRSMARRASCAPNGLLALRKLLTSTQPAAGRVHPALLGCSPLKPERLRGVDLLVVRELTGGLYYGEPRGRNGKSAVTRWRYRRRDRARRARRVRCGAGPPAAGHIGGQGERT